MNFYAKLNNDRICEQIVATPKVITNVIDYIEIDNYNDDLVWRKWEGNQWSAKKYIPKIDPSIQEKLDDIDSLSKSNEENKLIIKKLQEQNNILSDTLDFILSGGVE